MSQFVRSRATETHARMTGSRRHAAQLYERHGGMLFRQAYLTLSDHEPAEQVVCDVLVGECRRPAAPSDRLDLRGRLAVAAYWRCRELAAPGYWQSRPSATWAVPGPADPGQLSGGERGVLALVLFGGLTTAQAARELAIPAAELAALLRTIMCELSPAPA
jgi:hypothetical protein